MGLRFSQRINKAPIKTILQVESMDDGLKNRLWNVFLEIFFNNLGNYNSSRDTYGETSKGSFCLSVWRDFFGRTVDTIPSYSDSFVDCDSVQLTTREWFFEAEWYEVYDFLEFTVNKHIILADFYNSALKKEVSGYRIVNGQVVQITSELEIQEIEQAITETDQWKSVNIHLEKALELFSDRQNPDYRNSIKESISAVEALCLKLGGNANRKFGDSLTEIEKQIPLHGGLKRAFIALYGYTSDEGGIRHSLTDEGTTPTSEDAKFMLVSCSAFINYLKAKMNL